MKSGEIPLDLQSKPFRVLQEGEFERVADEVQLAIRQEAQLCFKSWQAKSPFNSQQEKHLPSGEPSISRTVMILGKQRISSVPAGKMNHSESHQYDGEPDGRDEFGVKRQCGEASDKRQVRSRITEWAEASDGL